MPPATPLPASLTLAVAVGGRAKRIHIYWGGAPGALKAGETQGEIMGFSHEETIQCGTPVDGMFVGL